MHDVLIALIKHMEVRPVQHLLRLITNIDLRQCSEQTLHLASSLIKYLWSAAAQHHQLNAANAQAHYHHMMDSGKCALYSCSMLSSSMGW